MQELTPSSLLHGFPSSRQPGAHGDEAISWVESRRQLLRRWCTVSPGTLRRQMMGDPVFAYSRGILPPRLLTTILVLGNLLTATSAALAQSADIVIIDATVMTMDESNRRAEAISITGNSITYVGDEAGVQSQIGEGTRVVDAGGRLILPGFVESHLHLLIAGAAISGLVLEQSDSAEDITAKLAAYAQAHPGDTAIFGTGVNALVLSSGEAHRSILDKAVPDRAVVILDETFHNAWVNTKALEIAEIAPDTPDVPNGTYVRDEKGEATGVIQGGPAHIPVIVATNAVSSETIADAMPQMLEILSAFGFTSLIEMGFPLSTEVGYQSLVDLDNAGRLPVRVSLAYYFNSAELGKTAIATIEGFSKRFKSEHVWLDTLKILADGTLENRKAAFLEPYEDVDSKGDLTVDEDFLRETAIRAADMGFNITAHTVGDYANRAILDVYEGIRDAGHDDVVLSTTHSWFVHPDDVSRWSENDVIVQTTGIWMFQRPSYIDAVGLERNNQRQFPLRSWADDGVVFAFGSDYPATDGGVEGLNPFNNIYGLLKREIIPNLIEEVGAQEGPLPPADQVLTVEEAVRGYTVGGAEILGKSDELGTITVGKKADLVILSQNLFAVDLEDIPNTDVMMTMMGGRITYVDPSLGIGHLGGLHVGHEWQE